MKLWNNNGYRRIPDQVVNVHGWCAMFVDVELYTIANFSLKPDNHRANCFKHTDSGMPLST